MCSDVIDRQPWRVHKENGVWVGGWAEGELRVGIMTG